VKQLLQRLDNGETFLMDVPVPSASGHMLLVQSQASVISAGTERMLVEFGRGNWLEKAKSQPDKVREVMDKMRTDGIGPTLEAVRAKLDQPIPLGYCNAGVAIEVGPKVTGIRQGNRVVTNGSHAEFVRVPHLLAARIPDNVGFEDAAFTPVAAIALQGIRLAQVQLGEAVVVYGLGLIGLLTVQLLRAQGCRVLGIDRDAGRLALAAEFGAEVARADQEDVVARAMAWTGDVGVDAVLLTLASTSDEPVLRAAEMSRKKGRIVLVGVTGLRLSRDSFYKKELSFTVSCSYGPGRYDPFYEDQGHDYPIGYVRWTEQRNFEAVLRLMSEGQLRPGRLITHRFSFAEAPKAYDVVTGNDPSLGIVLSYPEVGAEPLSPRARVLERLLDAAAPGKGVLGLIGAGNFATRVLLPALKAAGFHMRTVVSSGGVSGAHAGAKFNFARTATTTDAVFDDPEIDAVVIATRHDSHASLTIRALEAGKHVFVEKPLALTEEDVARVEAAARASGRTVMVGFNRRFAPMTVEAREALRGRVGPLAIVATMNAGAVPSNHWTRDPATGGGRIVGEASHFIDLARALVGAPIVGLDVSVAKNAHGLPVDDVAQIALRFEDGSIATVNYLANGSKAYPKERVECFFDGKTLIIDNWRYLRRYGISGRTRLLPTTMDKGHASECREWYAAILKGVPAVPLEEVAEVSIWSARAGVLAREAASP
jgi:predicted dehydrogenase/threonine dehydrogenase-like Zn-dependent dehydrogenase